MLIACLFHFLNGYTQTDSPVLFEVDNDPIYLSEFKYIYEKNNSDNADYSQESIDEYLELYKKFKLKVKRAQAIGLDTVKVLQDELAGYRKQLAKSYLKDKEISERLVLQVIERMKQDVEVNHIFVASPAKSNAEDKVKALEKINNIYDKLKTNNGQFFGEMAKTLSEDRATSGKAGRLGYYTSPLPDGFYEFENAMYDTPVGDISKPVKSKMGYHILQIKNKRPSRGQMEIAHILIRKNNIANSDPKGLVDSVYNLLKEGRNFENMAAKFSYDEKTKQKGGYLGFFGINQYELSFENAAFDLKTDDSYSKPTETNIGYHIIKRISKRDNSDIEKLKKRVEARIRNNDRFTIAEEKLIEDVKKEAGFKEDKLSFKRFATALGPDFFSYKWEAPTYENDLELFNLNNESFPLSAFADYAKQNIRERLKFSKNTPLEDAAASIYDSFVKEQVMAYEEDNLENKYPDFKALMQEYREGILLFEITKQEVWDKASQDTTGLNKFYSDNSSNYMWPERVKTFKYSIKTDNDQRIIGLYKDAQKKDHSKLLEKYASDKEIGLTFVEEVLNKDDKLIENLKLESGSVTQLALNPPPASFYKFRELVKPSNKSLAEAKGYVIADYQDYLEKKWIEDLKSKYPIDLNQKVLKSITK